MTSSPKVEREARGNASDVVSDAGGTPLLGLSLGFKGTASPASGQMWLDGPRLPWRPCTSQAWSWCSPTVPAAVDTGVHRSDPRGGTAATDFPPMLSSAREQADDISPAPASCPRRKRSTAIHWIGSEGSPVSVGARSYRLSFSFVGSHEDPAVDAAVIDPRLDVAAEPADPSISPPSFTSYSDLSPGERRAYLDWHDTGRRNSAVGAFCPLLLLHSLECALVRDNRTEIALAVKEELESLIDLHADRVFQSHARKLQSICDWLDPEHVPPAICASAAANYGDKIPQEVLHYLGWAVHNAKHLDADQALLLLLQQSGTHLGACVAQNFAQLHCFWVEAFPHHEAGSVVLPPTLPRLELTYSLIYGNFSRSYPSDMPDVSSIPLPDEYRRLFEQCAESLAPLDGQPIGKPLPSLKNMALKVPESHEMLFRQTAVSWLEQQIPETSAVKMRASHLLAKLYEHPPLKAKKMVEVARVKQLSRDLDELGFGFEPDPRLDLPKFRPESWISVFRSDPFNDEDAVEELFLGQSATVLGTLGHLSFPVLKVPSISEIESRLPFRYRYTDAQVRRLEAVRSCVEMIENRRMFLGSWISLLARKKDRINDIYNGFGIAFAGQRRQSHLTKFANSIHLVRPGLVKSERLLFAASELYDGGPAENSGSQVDIAQAIGSTFVREEVPPDKDVPDAIAPEPEVPLPGLRQSDSYLVRAIIKRPRSRAEFGEMAKARGTSVAGATDRINEWVLQNIRSPAFSDREQVALTPLAAEWINSLANLS